MAIAFIAGAVVGGLIGAMLVYAYELKTLSMFDKKVTGIERQFKHLCEITPRVAYICNRKFCEKCDNPECNHVFDIRYAKNFECIADNEYWEKDTDAGDESGD